MPDPLYRIQKAAELSGVSEELIRAWERRYRVLTPERTDTGHRLYSARDVAILKRLRELTEEGLAIREAAKLVPDLLRDLSRAEEDEVRTSSDTPSLTRWQEDILLGAERLEQRRIDRALDEALAALPPLTVAEELIIPALREVGDRWHRAMLDVAQEHLATHALRGRLMSLLHGAPQGMGAHVIVACFPEEQHEVGALLAALQLRYSGYRVTSLGQRTPIAQLVRITTELRPRAVFLSAVNDVGPRAFEEVLLELRAGLPSGVAGVVGGRAANEHRAMAERHDFKVFGEGGWARVFSELGSA